MTSYDRVVSDTSPENMNGITAIQCRSQISDDCYEGRPITEIYEDGMENDGTFDPRSDTVICDACYAARFGWTVGRTDEK